MVWELILAILCGVSAGTITGLAPGIHINLISAFLISSLPFTNFPPIGLAVFISSMSITHTFLDFIPSIFLGAPEEENFLSVLPGHKMLMEGQGYSALIITVYGCLLGTFLAILISPIFAISIPFLYSLIKSILPFILIFISFYIILRNSIILSLTCFMLSGILGLLTFNLPVEQPLLPLLSGLFGLSNLLLSLNNKSSPPSQFIPKLKEIHITKREFLSSLLSSTLVAPLCSFLPGIGSGHAATISSELSENSPKSFLFSIGLINSIVMILSFTTAFAIEKTRTGSAAAIKTILVSISIQDLTIILVSCLLASLIAFILTILIGKSFAYHLRKINYKFLNIIVIILVVLVNIIFTNFLGLLILVSATFIGLFCISSNSRRINLMGCLILPSIIYLLT